MRDVTQILADIESGNPQASAELLPIVYEELRQLAKARMAHERPDHTLQCTALVHEAYLRLVDNDRSQHWDSRGHFFAAAAEAMRRILIENARGKASVKRGGGRKRIELIDQAADQAMQSDQVLAVDEALTALEATDAKAAALVKLRFFVGMSLQEAADALGLSERTAYREWSYARAWLYRYLQNDD